MKKLMLFITFLLSIPVYSGNCDYSYQTDKRGYQCGGRSKYDEYGRQRRGDNFYHYNHQYKNHY